MDMNKDRCEVALATMIRCSGNATFTAVGWGWGSGRDGMQVCEDHARDAISDGARVHGPGGGQCHVDDDGNVIEEE